MKKVKIIGLVVLIIVLVAVLGVLVVNAIRSIPYNKQAKNPIVTFDIEGYGEVQMELYPDYAPNTVSTIVKLVQNKYYDGKVFYGIDDSNVYAGMIKNEVTEEETETAETTETSTDEKNAIEDAATVSDLDLSVVSGSTSDYNIEIPGEFVANGYEENTLRFEKGVVGLDRTTYSPISISSDTIDLTAQSYNSGSSKFFICMEENSSRNGLYAPFGKITKGFDIIEEIYKLKTIEDEETQLKYFESLPTIKSATVETFGVDYGMPEYTEAFDYSSYLSDYLLQYYSN